MANLNPFKRSLAQFTPYLVRLPSRISQRALLEIKNNFTRQGYENDLGRFVYWQQRETLDKKKTKRALLILTGRLRRSIKSAPLPNTPRVVTDVAYAEALNDGFKGTQYVKAHKRVATITRKVRGSYSGFGKKPTAKKLTLQGTRHNVKGFSRKVNITARPFMTVGPSFLQQEENKLLDDLENIFLRA